MVKMCKACPFNFCSEESEQAQNWGCLPDPHQIMKWQNETDRIWECHSIENQPCAGQILKTVENKGVCDFSKPLITQNMSKEEIYVHNQ